MTEDKGNKVQLSVCVITYNHSRFIAQCLDSILEQKTNFAYEVIVGDDCSTDNTQDILQSYAEKHPNQIKLKLQPSNTGGSRNYFDVHSMASGRYVAHIDGDDIAYPQKLQTQFDALEKSSDAALAAHAVNIIGSEKTYGCVANIPPMGTMSDLLRLGAYFVHSSVMYRRSMEFRRLPEQTPIDYYMNI